jgi:uncharacterized protein (DUF885 family)
MDSAGGKFDMPRIVELRRFVIDFKRKFVKLRLLILICTGFVVLMVGGCGSPWSEKEPSGVAQQSTDWQATLTTSSPIPGVSVDPSTFDEFLEEAFFAQITRDPELISELGLANVFGMDNSQLTNVSNTFQLETYDLLRSHLDTLHAYDRVALNSGQQLSYDIFEWYLDDLLRGQEWRFYDYPINQTLGIQNMLIEFMTDRHSISNFQDARDYISRLEQFTVKFQQLVEWLNIQREQGVIPPKFVVQRVLSQLDWYSSQDPDDSALYTVFVDKVFNLNDVDSGNKEQLFRDALNAIEKSVLPAYQELRAYFKNLEGIADTDDGFWKHPNGNDAYTYWLRHHTTVEMSAEGIHELGLQEVDRIQTEMEALFSEFGITGDSLAKKLESAAIMGGTLPISSASDRQAVVDEYQRLINHANESLSDYFDVCPEASVVVVPFEAPNAPGAYYVHPAIDGSRPGMFYVNLTGDGVDRYDMPTLVYHEAIPGHHFQIAIQQELTNIPTFRTGINYTAYAEGWALYAEYLAWEIGFYKDDPYGDLGRLQNELFRAARLVVDTGIHAMGWSREKAIEYMVENVGYSERKMTTEVERYIVWPGQATAYKIGMLKIQELRQRTMKALGDDFNIKEFHNLILMNGAMPLEILDQVVNNYIETAQNQ